MSALYWRLSMPKVKPPTKKELLARGFSERTARDLIAICKQINDLTDAEQQMVVAHIVSRYLATTPPIEPQ
jgi:hypothetical protein